MTHIIIGQNQNEVNEYLFKLLSKILGKEITFDFLHNSPDLHILKSENINSIGIEDVKDFQKEMVYKPFMEKYQIGIVLEADKLTHEAQNSFLKTLEEQPETTVYILVSQNQRNLLDTILSRGLKHILNQIKDVENNTQSFSGNIVDDFKLIEELSEKGVDEILKFLEGMQKQVQINIREGIVNDIDTSNNLVHAEVINRAYDRIKANGNKRLVLENLAISLYK